MCVAFEIALIGRVAQAQMTLVADATTTPAQVVIVPFYYAEYPYTTDITLTNHGSGATLWAVHFIEGEIGDEVCCVTNQSLGVPYLILDAGSSTTLHAEGSSTSGTVTASQHPGACMYPSSPYPAAGMPFLDSPAYDSYTLRGHVEFIPAADTAQVAELRAGDCANLPDPGANGNSQLTPPTGSLTATAKVSGYLGTAAVKTSGINGFADTSVTYVAPGSHNPGLDKPGSGSALVGGTLYDFFYAIDAVSAVFMTTDVSATLLSSDQGQSNYLGIVYPTKGYKAQYFSDPEPFLERFGQTYQEKSCTGIGVSVGGGMPVDSACGQYLVLNLFELLPQAGYLSSTDLVYRFDPFVTNTNSPDTIVVPPGSYNVLLKYVVDAANGTQGVLQSLQRPLYGQPAIPFVLQFQSPPAYNLGYAQQPTTTLANALMGPVKLQLQDVNGNLVSGSNAQVTLSLTTNPGGAMLGGTKTVNAVGGVATFNNLTLDKYGLGYKLTASAGGLQSATSNAFNIKAQLAFTTQPTNVVAGTVMSHDVVVQMRDANGSSIGGTPTITLTGNPGGEVAGSTSAVNGVATFSGVTLYVAGSGVTLTAAGPGLVSATSVPFNVTAGAPSRLAFAPQPVNAVVNAAIPAFGVRILDANNNLTASAAQVAIALGPNPTAATLSGTKTINAVAGIASFSALVLDKLGTDYTLKASAAGLVDAMSNSFNVVNDKIFANGFQ